MTYYEWTPDGPRPLEQLADELRELRAAGNQIVTTNGCFDVLHSGHAQFLADARAQGDVLVVGLNADASVRRLKGAGRPLVPQNDRATLLAALRVVDHVVIFEDETPNAVLAALGPSIHCKAGDYSADTLPEAETVRRAGGEVRILPLKPGYSTSLLVERILAAQGKTEPVAEGQPSPTTLVLDDANLVRQTGYAMRDRLVPAAELIARTYASGNSVSVVGNRVSGALVLTAGLDFGIYLPPGRSGDVLVVVLADAPPPELLRVVEAARERGIAVVTLLGTQPDPLADIADVALHMPTDEPRGLRLAMVAALRAIGALAAEHKHSAKS